MNSKWSQCEFQDLYLIPSKNGVSKPSKVRGMGYKMINMGELFSNDWIYDIPMDLVPLTEKEKENFKVKVNDLLFARQSLVASGAGKCSIVKEVSELTVFESHLIRVRLNPEIANSLFFYYYFKSPSSPIKSIIQHSVQAGIKASDLAKLTVCFPDIETQMRIASILGDIDRKIYINNAINKNLMEQAMSLYQCTFVDTVSDRKICRADEFFDIAIGKTPPRKEQQWFSKEPGNVTWVSISDMGSCGLYISDSSEYLTQEAVDKFNVVVIPDNTVLLSFKLTVGRLAITDGIMTTNEAIAHFKTDDPSINPYLYCYLKAFNYQSLGSTSSIATAVNSKIIKGMPFVVPNPDELSKFNSVVEPAFALIKANQAEIRNLSALRDALLPRLLNGTLDVSEIDF